MQLYNFLANNLLNQLREQMQAPLIDESDLPYQQGLTYAEIFNLFEGQEVTLDDVKIKDNLLYYKGVLISLNIQDITVKNEIENLPKLHIAFCQTLQKMKEGGRFKRYISSDRMDKKRKIRKVSNYVNSSIESEYDLSICQHCLIQIAWQKFGWHLPEQQRLEIASHFDLAKFYQHYEPQFHQDFIGQLSTTEESIVINDYTPNWKRISYEFRCSKNWTCEQCSKDCRQQHGLLHTHHINGLKHDNRKINLRALCFDCHAQQPFHEHMQRKDSYF